MKTCITLFVFALFTTVTFGQKVSIKDNVGNILMEVMDEGTTGSIILPGFFSPSVTTNKIYNTFGQLYWNGTKLGTATEAAGWTLSGSNLYPTNTSTMVGIGTTTPSSKLHLQGSSTGEIALTINNLNSTGSERLYFGSGVSDAGFLVFGPTHASIPGKFRFLNNYPNGYFDWVSGSAVRMTLDETGQLAIGPSSPTQKLDVDGKVRIGDDGITPAAGVLRYNSTDDAFEGHDGSGWNALTNKWLTNASNVYYNSGNVGIGTISPLDKLHVVGDMRLEQAANPILQFYLGGTYGGFIGVINSDYYISNNQIGKLFLKTQNTTRMTIDGDGDVGIGTDSPATLLHIQDNTTGVVTMTLHNTNDSGSERLFFGTSTGSDAYIQAYGSTSAKPGNFRFLNNRTSAKYEWIINGGVKMTLDNSGNLGIGTSSPSTLLHIQDNTTGVATMTLHNTNDSGSERLFFGTSTGSDAFIQVYGSTAASNTGKWRFLNNRTGANFDWVVDGSQKMLLDHDGNLGIGTTSPSAKNHIVQDVGGVDAFRVDDETGDATPFIIKSNGATAVGTTLPMAKMHIVEESINDAFRVDDESGDATPFVIADDGNVGIGTSSPQYHVHAISNEINGEMHSYFGWENDFTEIQYAVRGAHTEDVIGGLSRSQNTPSGMNYSAVFGYALDNSGHTNIGVFGNASGATNNWGGYFQAPVFVDDLLEVDGDVDISGNLTKGSGTFKIDHPLDPENKYLYHSFVESPDMMNVYNGNVVLDAEGKARVTLPDYFQALNMDFRYQLTAIGAPGPNLYIAREVSGNQFEIAGGEPDMKVSWLVTGVRKDPFAEQNRIQVEADKSGADKGTYLHPEAYGKPIHMKEGYQEHQAPR